MLIYSGRKLSFWMTADNWSLVATCRPSLVLQGHHDPQQAGGIDTPCRKYCAVATVRYNLVMMTLASEIKLGCCKHFRFRGQSSWQVSPYLAMNVGVLVKAELFRKRMGWREHCEESLISVMSWQVMRDAAHCTVWISQVKQSIYKAAWMNTTWPQKHIKADHFSSLALIHTHTYKYTR